MKFSSDKASQCAALFQTGGFATGRSAALDLLKGELTPEERVETTALALRIAMESDETGDFDSTGALAEEGRQLASKLRLPAALYYFGITFRLLEENETAEACFREALLYCKSPEESAYCHYGIAAVLNGCRRTDEALLELQKAENATSSDLRCLVAMLSGNIRKKNGQYSQALLDYQRAQRELPTTESFYLKNWVYFGLASIHARLGDASKARTLFEVAQSITHPVEFRRLYRLIETELSRLNWKVEALFDDATGDLTFSHGLVTLRRKPILIQIMTELIRHSPESVSKERLYRQVWKMDYHPLRHDNLLYNHVQRLRQIIGEDKALREIILTTIDGYRINPEILVRLKHPSEEKHE